MALKRLFEICSIVLLWQSCSVTAKSFHKIEEIASNAFLSFHRNASHTLPVSRRPGSSISKKFSYYGESCETRDDCALQLGLTCANSTCLCFSPEFIARLDPDKSLSNQRRTECVLRAGSKCGIQLQFNYRSYVGDTRSSVSSEDVAVTRTLSTAFIWNKLRKNLPFLTDVAGGGPLDFFDGDSNCVDNAHCTGGVCRCSPDHFKDPRGLCLRKKSVFQTCENGDDSQCQTSDGLRCLEGKCQCAQSMAFDRYKKKCFVPVGGECDAYSYSQEKECIRHSDCSNDRCVCLSGYKMSSDGTCGVAHGGLCDMQSNLCSDIQLTCRSGRCQCRYPAHQVYNETLGQCLSKPDGPCIPSSLITAAAEGVKESLSFQQNCVPFAECTVSPIDDEENTIFEYICKCTPGYAEDTTGTCVPSYASQCIEDEDCDQAIGQLTCINGRCACPDEMLTWDETRRKCVGVIGSRCKSLQFERILSFNNQDIPTECVENAHCVEHVSRLEGRCECQSGYEFSKSLLKCIPN